MHITWEFNYFHESAVGRYPAEAQTGILQSLAIFRIEFIAMAMTFTDFVSAVGLMCQLVLG